MHEYGLTDLVGYGIFDYSKVYLGFFYKHNFKEIYLNGELIFTATYKYNSENYPTSMSYNYLLNGESGYEEFVYN